MGGNGGYIGYDATPKGFGAAPGLWGMRDVYLARRRGTWPGYDPYWSSVIALLHMDGADGSTTFTDAAGKRTITRGGSAQIDTAQSQFGGASGLFAVATQDYLRFDAHADWNFGSGDFCIETFLRPASTAGGGGARVFQTADGDTFSGLLLYLDAGTNNLILYAGSTGSSWNLANAVASGSLTTGVWKHVAIERVGSVLSVYVDGVQQSTTNIGTSALYFNAAHQPIFMGQSGANRSFDGWGDELRVTKASRYKGAFTPPAIAFPER